MAIHLFFDIIVAITIIVGAEFVAFQYPSFQSLIARGGFYLTCGRLCVTSVFNNVVAVGYAIC